MLQRLSIAQRLSLAFSGAVVVLVVVAGVSIFSGKTSTAALNRMVEIADDQATATRAAHSLGTLRLAVKNFLLSNAAEDVEAFQATERRFLEDLNAADQAFQNPQRRALLEAIRADFKRYQEQWREVVASIARRNELRDEVVPARVAALREAVQALAAARWDGNEAVAETLAMSEAAAETAGVAQRVADSRGRLGADVLEAPASALSAALDGIESVMTSPSAAPYGDVYRSDPGPATNDYSGNLAVARTALAELRAALNEIAQTNTQRNQLVLEGMDRVGPRINTRLDEIVKMLDDERRALAAETQRSNHVALWATQTAALIGLVGAIAMAFLIVRSIVGPLGRLQRRMADIAEGEGDLTQRVDVEGRDELSELSRSFNAFVEKIQVLVREVQASAEMVASASAQIAAASEETSRGMYDQSEQIEHIATAMEEMSAAVTDVAARSTDAARHAAEAGEAAEEGGQVVAQTVGSITEIADTVRTSADAVRRLGERGAEIGEIIEVINEIAAQTNLLALNAAIEAARAGEHGRGFAVVAGEVRRLADRTTEATEQIAGSIRAIQEETGHAVDGMESSVGQVEAGVAAAKTAGEHLSVIVADAAEVSRMIDSIATASEQQSAVSNEVAESIERIANVARETSAASTESSAVCGSLKERAGALLSLVSRFRA